MIEIQQRTKSGPQVARRWQGTLCEHSASDTLPEPPLLGRRARVLQCPSHRILDFVPRSWSRCSLQVGMDIRQLLQRYQTYTQPLNLITFA